MRNNTYEQVSVLIESMFAFADQGIDPSVLCETTIPEIDNYGYYGLLEDTAEAAGLFAKLNQGRKDLVQKIQNIDWKEWVKKMKETLAKIWRFITAPARTLKELVTGKTTLKQIGERIKTVWRNLRNKKNKTPEEKEAEPKLAAVAKDIEKAEEMVEKKIEAKEGSGDDGGSSIKDANDSDTFSGDDLKNTLKKFKKYYNRSDEFYNLAEERFNTYKKNNPDAIALSVSTKAVLSYIDGDVEALNDLYDIMTKPGNGHRLSGTIETLNGLLTVLNKIKVRK